MTTPNWEAINAVRLKAGKRMDRIRAKANRDIYAVWEKAEAEIKVLRGTAQPANWCEEINREVAEE